MIPTIRTPASVKDSFTGPVGELLQILSWKRPHNSPAEEQFTHQFIDPLGVETDSFGNRFLRIGNQPTLFSSHLDTVHHSGGYQRLDIFPDEDGLASTIHVHPGDGNCLGADDGTGIWLMLNMIRANRPGLYVFHRAEERGCQGSSHIARNEKPLLNGIRHAVAFDRKGYTSVITHQRGQRTCSDAFAKAMSTALGSPFTPDDTGVYTDTAEYTGLVPECTNLSVGYFNQHGPTESQDILFATNLLRRLLALDFSTIPAERDPKKTEYKSPPLHTTYQTPPGGYNQTGNYHHGKRLPVEMTLSDLCEKFPFLAARYLGELGFYKDDFLSKMHPSVRAHPK